MKTIILSKLELTNFKKFKELVVEFGPDTVISGGNRTGKSTIFDAFKWLLFGVDSRGSSDFSIKTLVNGSPIPQIPHGVRGTFFIDGSQLILERVLTESWVKKAGAAQKVFEGHTTAYFVGVDNPVKAGEYAARVSEIIDGFVFKLVTDPRFFSNLHWTKQREQLILMAGEISKGDIIKDDFKLHTFIESLNGQSLADFKNTISFKIKEIEKELEKIPVKLEQTIKLRPEDRDWNAIELEIKALEGELKMIEEQEMNLNSKALEINKFNSGITEKIGNLERQKSVVLNARRIETMKIADKENEKLNEYYSKQSAIESKYSSLRSQVANINSSINERKALIKKLESEVGELRVQYSETSSKVHIQKDGCLVCPLFGHECTDKTAVQKEGEAYVRSSEEFNRKKASILEDIRTNGVSIAGKINVAKQELAVYESKLSEMTSEIESHRTALESVNGIISSFVKATPEQVNADSIAEIIDINNKIAALKGEYKTMDTQAEKADKSAIRSKINSLSIDLSIKSMIEKSIKEEGILKERESQLEVALADLKGKVFLAEKYEANEMAEVESRVNSMFSVVKFNLFKHFNNGTSEPWCNITVAGVPYSDVNTADQVNAGIDIINTLSKYYGVTAPIFIDNAEGVDEIIGTNSQIVRLVVRKGQSLNIL